MITYFSPIATPYGPLYKQAHWVLAIVVRLIYSVNIRGRDARHPLKKMPRATLRERYVPVLFQLVRSTDIESQTYYSIMNDLQATADDYHLISTPYTEDEYAKKRAWLRQHREVAK